MTPEDLRAWQAEMGYTYDRAAAELGIGRRTYADWLAGRTIPGPVGLACAALAAGLAPYGQHSLRDAIGHPPLSRSGHEIKVGEDVIITRPSHLKYKQIGEYVGPANMLAVSKYRICFDGDIVLASQGDFDVA